MYLIKINPLTSRIIISCLPFLSPSYYPFYLLQALGELEEAKT